MTRKTNKHGYDIYTILPDSMYTKGKKKDRSELYTAITMALFIIIVGGIIILSL